MIRRRHVFYVAGYDPQGVPGYHRLFRRELQRFQQLWLVQTSCGDPQLDADGLAARWQIETHGPNWQVATTYEFLRWDDLVARDLARPFFGIFLRVLYCLGENLSNGTLFRTFRAGWRFGLFYLLSIFAMTATIASAVLFAWLAYFCVRNFLPDFLAGALPALGAAIVTGVLFLALARSLCRRWLITRICAMWPWYAELAHKSRPDLQMRIGEFARRIIAKARAGDADEILVVGHSAGGTLLVPLIARALERDADFAGAGSSVIALALGSNLPLAALHPNGDDFRRAIRRVAVEPSLAWIDCQARKDVVNFQDCDMVSGLGVEIGSEQQCNPLYWKVRFRDLVSAEFYPRLRWDFFRMHYQFVMANDRRAPYDYFMFVCGPVRLLDWAQDGAQTLARFAQDGSCMFDGADQPQELARPAPPQ
jgi:hypothetical protein